MKLKKKRGWQIDKKLKILQLSGWFLIASTLLFPAGAAADWPMAGQNNQRTSVAPDTSPSTYNRGCGAHNFSDYIPSKSHIVTVERSGAESLIYVTTSAGVYALKATPLTDSASDIAWFYPTSQPVGHSPTVDKTTDVIYIPSLDKTVHALNAVTGQKIWQTLKAGGGFQTSPLVANNLVYVGNRDGYVYAFNTSDGSLAWYFQTEGPVDYSAAISADNRTLYIGSHDSHAYALNAITGSLIARSKKFQGRGFYTYWPVVNTSANRVIFTGSYNYPDRNYVDSAQNQVLPDEPSFRQTTQNSIAAHTDWLRAHPDQKVYHLLDPISLTENPEEIAPYLFWGDPNGNRYPPVITADGTIWALSPWFTSNTVGFPQGRFMGWKLGEPTFYTKPSRYDGLESFDEPQAFAIFANAVWFAHGGDGFDGGGVASMGSNYSLTSWRHEYLAPMVGNFWRYWHAFNYGNGITMNSSNTFPTTTGTHGYQNPPVPLLGKAYLHRSNSVVCLQP